MAPRMRVDGVTPFLLLVSACMLVLLVYPLLAAAQAKGCAPGSVSTDRNDAIDELTSIRSALASDLDDVAAALDRAIEKLRANLLLLDRDQTAVSLDDDDEDAETECETVVALPFFAELSAAERRLLCRGEQVYSNDEEAAEAVVDAVEETTDSALRDELLHVVACKIHAAAGFVADVQIQTAGLVSGLSTDSDSAAIDDARAQQDTAGGQSDGCLLGVERDCGDAVGSFFDAWVNAIIEIIR